MDTIAQYTIVFVADDTIVRVDMPSGNARETIRSSRLVRPDDSSLGEAVALALGDGSQADGAGSDGRVWVLTDELWSGRVSLDNGVASAISPDQLEQTLALQAEQESGIAPFESRLSQVPVPRVNGQATWWVTQVEQTQLDEVEAAIPKWVGNFGGLAAIALSPDQSLEFADIDDGTSQSHEQFASEWLTHQLSGTASIPVVRTHVENNDMRRQWVTSLLYCTAILVVCLAHYLYSHRELAKFSDTVTRLTAYQKQLRSEVDRTEALASARANSEQKSKEQQAAEFRRLAKLKNQRSEFVEMRKRPTQVLGALAVTANQNHWIQKIDFNDQQALVSGLAVDCSAITTLSQRLELELGSSTWWAQPAKLAIVSSNGLVQFELPLIPIDRPVRPPTELPVSESVQPSASQPEKLPKPLLSEIAKRATNAL